MMVCLFDGEYSNNLAKLLYCFTLFIYSFVPFFFPSFPFFVGGGGMKRVEMGVWLCVNGGGGGGREII